MKNKQLLFNIFLALGLVVLYVLHFTGGGSSSDSEEIVAADTVQTDTVTTDSIDLSIPETQALSFPIAYINIDSIDMGYQFVIDERERLSKRHNYLRRQLENEAKRIAEDQRKFGEQMQAGMYKTEAEAQAQYNRLQKEQQDFMAREQSTMQLMQKESGELSQKAWSKVNEYLKENSSKLKYSYVLSKSILDGSVLYGNDSLNITSQLLKALNQDYKESKSNQ